MKFFAAVMALTFSFLFVVFCLVGSRESVVVEEVAVSESSEDSIDSLEVEDDAYSYGFRRGRACFLVQMGEEVSVPDSARYVVDGHWSEEEVGRGYVDGYHRAADTFSCPGCR